MAVGNNTVEHDLMKVGSLKLKHLIDTSSADLVRRLPDLRLCALLSSESSANQVLAVLVEQIKCVKVSA